MALDHLKLPTETVELPSKGLLYSPDNPLSSGKVELKYMTAKEEDILTNAAYIKQGIVLDKLIKSMLVSKINYEDLLIGDKNAIIIASRVLGYGKDYKFTYNGNSYEVDLSTLENTPIDETLFTPGNNEFDFTLPNSGIDITFKFLTQRDENNIQKELDGLKKLNNNDQPEVTTRLKYLITSVGGSRESKDIRQFVDTYLLAKDARALRSYIQKISPDVDLLFFPEGNGESFTIPIGVKFFWPDL